VDRWIAHYCPMMDGANATELRAINKRLRALGITPDQLTLRPLDASQVWVEGTLLGRLDPDYGPKLGHEFVYRTAGLSMEFEAAWAALDTLVPGWSSVS
jgi:hypothetical protein